MIAVYAIGGLAMSRSRFSYSYIDLNPFADNPVARIAAGSSHANIWKDCFPLNVLLREFAISGKFSSVYQFMTSVVNGIEFDFSKHAMFNDAAPCDKPLCTVYMHDTFLRISVLNYMAHNPKLTDPSVSDRDKLTSNLGDFCAAYHYYDEDDGAFGKNEKFFEDWADLIYASGSDEQLAERTDKANKLIAEKYAIDDALTAKVDAAWANLKMFCDAHPLTVSDVDEDSDMSKIFFLLEDYYVKAGMASKANELIKYHFDRMTAFDMSTRFSNSGNPSASEKVWRSTNYPLRYVNEAVDRSDIHYLELFMGYFDALRAYVKKFSSKDRIRIAASRTMMCSIIPAFVKDFRYLTKCTDRYDDAQIDDIIAWYNARRNNLCDLSIIRMVDRMRPLGDYDDQTALNLISLLDQSMPLMTQCFIDAQRTSRYYSHNYGREKNMMMWLICYYDEMPDEMRSRFAGVMAKYIDTMRASKCQAQTMMSIIRSSASNPLSMLGDIGDRCKCENIRSMITENMLC